MALTGGWEHLGLAVAAFLGAHSLTNVRPLRDAALIRFGKRGFYGGYSVLSTLLLVWVVAAALDAPMVVLWEQEPWMRWVPSLAMPFSCIALVAALTTPNPFSVGPGGAGYDPARPGILRLTRHPAIWGLGLWSGAHLVPNGNLAGVLLFLPLFALCLLGARVLDAKRRRQLGPERWEEWSAALDGSVDWRRLLSEMGWARLLGGLALFPVLMALHPLIIGRSPFP